MELKTLWLGLLISVAAFAVKTGLGWAYLWAAAPPGRKPAASAAVAALYALVFAGVYLLAAKVNLLAHYDLFEPLWQHGLTLHWLVAALMFFWGFLLLRQRPEACCAGRTKGWLALVIPCPVCLSVLFMSTTGLTLYFPQEAARATAALFGAFALLALAAGLMALKGRSPAAGAAERTLGLTMMLTAAYFMVSALILPQFAEISKVYRLAAYAAENKGGGPTARLEIWGLVLAVAAGAFHPTRRRLRKAALNHQRTIAPPTVDHWKPAGRLTENNRERG